MVLRKYEEKLKRAVANPYQNATSFKKEDKHDLAIVRYPSLSIDLLYDFKKVQPMPNHPTIFFFSTYLKKKRSIISFLPFPSLSNNARNIIVIKSQLLKEEHSLVTSFITNFFYVEISA